MTEALSPADGASGVEDASPAAVDVTVVILTWNGERYLEAILASLRQQRYDGVMEVLVIDSGSTDRTLQIVAAHPEVRLHEIPNSEFGHGRTRNLAAHLAHGRHVVYLTHDAVPSHDRWLYEILKPFELNPRVAAVMGSQIPRPWCFPLLKYEIRAVFQGFGPGFGTTLFYVDDFVQDEAVRNAVTFYSDVNSAARREVLIGEVPYRDVSYAEDQLLGRDLVDAGYLKAYAPRASVVHSNDMTLAEYDERMVDETKGLREVGIDVAVPAWSVIARMVVRGVVRDQVHILRDGDFGLLRKIYWSLVNPLFHLQKWRGVRRGALEPLAPVGH
ncbi:rhamnosyltransferase [Actinotalea ferrariae CF5-4]|uniref:Rhamnosyltransferase n=1 Tax=Actinotalea ferrariae CF5-4 TaxID=948458 RepID=A0A021VXM2_9CELL|nr:glycosyltransferase family A protein [Actinotalea ferrariae]EYR64780.1 rhamnosyltransferase [Actinotalea ferrariae CF5-4]